MLALLPLENLVNYQLKKFNNLIPLNMEPIQLKFIKMQLYRVKKY